MDSTKMKTKRQKGFTLIELMIAVMAGVVLILAAGMVLSIGHTFWNKSWEEANLQRSASYALLIMSHSIRAATSAQEEAGGTALIIHKQGTSDIRFSYVEATNELRSQFGAQPETIINDKVEDLQFNVEGKKVTIDLRLQKDNAQTHLVSTVMMRNYGG
jgi:prepilin-type N-terminal cleavage/methylation domain-containing protein